MKEFINENRKGYLVFLLFAALCFLLPLLGADSIGFAEISLSPVPLLAGACLLQRKRAGALLGAVLGAALLLRYGGSVWTTIAPMLLTGLIAAAAMRGFLRITGDETPLARCSAAFAAVLSAHFCYGALGEASRLLLSPAASHSAVQIFSHTVNEGNLVELLLCEAAALPLCARFAPQGGTPTVLQKFSRMLLLLLSVSLVVLTYGVYFLQSYDALRTTKKTLGINLEDIGLEIDRAQRAGQGVQIVAWRWRIGGSGWAAILENGKLVSSPNPAMLGKTVAEAGWGGQAYIAFGKDAGIGRYNGIIAMYAAREYGAYRILCFIPLAEVFAERDLICAALFVCLAGLCTLIYVLVVSLYKKVIVADLTRVNGVLSAIALGNLQARVEVEDTTEFMELSRDINATADALRRAIAAEAARLDAELACARDVQRSALPAPIADNAAFSVSALIRPANMVGGDFYDYYYTDATHFAVLVADVCDKGIPAALYMMRAKTALKELLMSGMSPAQAVNATNARLCEENAPGMFVTLWLGVLDLERGALTCVNGGHNPPLLLRKSGEPEWLRQISGLFLGSFPKVRYEAFTVQLEAGDLLLLYTDGVNESQNTNGDFYGNDRLFTFARAPQAPCTPHELLPALLADVDAFAEGAEQSDDITLLALRCKEAKQPLQ